jgi:zinc protease
MKTLTGQVSHTFSNILCSKVLRNISRGQFDKYVENAGGSLNAYTSFDVTNYYVLLPSNQLELGLWLESERLLHAIVDSIGIQTQKSVVIEEKKQTMDNQPYGTILYETVKRAYTDHPYSWVIIGDENHIREAEDHEFREFHEMFYVPNNAVLVIAGDIEIDRMKPEELVKNISLRYLQGKKEIYRPDITEARRTQKSGIRYMTIFNCPWLSRHTIYRHGEKKIIML